MVFANLVPRNQYHKNGTQWLGKMINKIIGESNYDSIRCEKRILYAKFWYLKQTALFRFQTQYPNIAQLFSLLNKQDTSSGFPSKRQYERHQDFAVFNINHEGWFQLYFFVAAAGILLWNWWMLAFYYEIRG